MFKLKDSKYLAGKPNLQLAVRGFSYFLSEKMSRVAVGFILQTWLARHLGPENMGVYSYVADFVALFIPIVLFGLDDVLIKEFVTQKDPEKVLGTVLYFRLALSLIVWIFLCLSIYVIRRETMDVVYLTIFYGTLICVRTLDTYYSFFHAKFLVKQLVNCRQAAFFIGSVTRAAGLWAGAGIVYFFFNNYLQFFLERFFTLLYSRNHIKGRLKFDLDYLKTLFPLALPIAMTSFFSYGETRMGTFFLNKYSTLESVGEFGVGRGLLDLWDFLPTTLCLTLFPVIISSKGTSIEAYKDKLRKLYAGLFYLALGFAISISLVAPWIIKVLYGVRYDQTVNVLIYGSFLAIITYINFARVKWYILENDTTAWLKICFLTFVLNFCFQFYFTPKFGIIGPYMASFSAHLVGNIFMSIFNRKVREDLLNVAAGIIFPFKILKRA